MSVGEDGTELRLEGAGPERWPDVGQADQDTAQGGMVKLTQQAGTVCGVRATAVLFPLQATLRRGAVCCQHVH